MITINSYTKTRFKLNGFPCAKVYQIKPGTDKESITLLNVNDTSDVLFRNKNIEQISVNGTIYSNVNDLADAIENLLYAPCCGEESNVNGNTSGDGAGIGVELLNP